MMLKTTLNQQLSILFEECLAYEGYKLGIQQEIQGATPIPTFKLLEKFYKSVNCHEVSKEEMCMIAGKDEIVAWVGSKIFFTADYLDLSPWMQLAYSLIELINMNNYYYTKNKKLKLLEPKDTEPLSHYSIGNLNLGPAYLKILYVTNIYKYLGVLPQLQAKRFTLGFNHPKLTQEKIATYVQHLLQGDTSLGKVTYILEVDNFVLCNMELLRVRFDPMSGMASTVPLEYDEVYLDKNTCEVLNSKSQGYAKLRNQYQIIKKLSS